MNMKYIFSTWGACNDIARLPAHLEMVIYDSIFCKNYRISYWFYTILKNKTKILTDSNKKLSYSVLDIQKLPMQEK